MKFFVNEIFSRTSKANMVSLSFVGVEAIPQSFIFSIFVPKSIELKEGEVNELPHWITKNIWTNDWILKDLMKQAKKSVHKRAEKLQAVSDLLDAMDELKTKDVEEPIEETGEYIGNKGDVIYGPFKAVKYLHHGSTTYTGIWRQFPSIVTGNCYWGHPSVDWVLWELTDMEGHCIILKCNNDVMNDRIGTMMDEGKFFQMKADIIDHSVFRGVRQTKIRVRKQDLIPVEE